MTYRESHLFSALCGSAAQQPERLRSNEVATKWLAVTGAPGSGKTTICDLLAKSGKTIVPEVSREAILDAVRAGFSLDEIRKSPTLLAEAVALRKVYLANSTLPTLTCIWDTALVDAVVFARRAGALYSVPAQEARRFQFRGVVILAPLPHDVVRDDPVRPQNEEERRQIHEALCSAYSEFGYTAIHIEVASLQERFAIVEAAIRSAWS